MTGRQTILITGSTDGIGRIAALRLADEGAHVLIHGRDRARGKAVAGEIARAGGSAKFYPADLASLAAVRELAEAVLADQGHIDVLVNNAAVGFGRDQREVSTDGFELRFVVNYLAVFLLTRLLMPRLGGEKPSRIVNVASIGQHEIDFSDIMNELSYDGRRAYRQAKLAEIMFTFDLAEELAGRGVIANALHPATLMDTAMVREAGVAPRSTADQGAAALLALIALDGRTGLFFNGLNEAGVHAQAYDADARRRLRELSFRLTGLIDPRATGA